jgi:protein-serine/threonine kinase
MFRNLLMRKHSSRAAPPEPEPHSRGPSDYSPEMGPLPTSVMIEPLYGEKLIDAGDEVRFSVELTRIDRLDDTFSLDIRRLKGNLRSYKFLYDTLRE